MQRFSERGGRCGRMARGTGRTGIGAPSATTNAKPKPFSYGELRRRIEALLHRCGGRRRRGLVRVGDLEVDPVAREVRLRGERVRVSAKEFALLTALVADPTRVFTKEELLRDV